MPARPAANASPSIRAAALAALVALLAATLNSEARPASAPAARAADAARGAQRPPPGRPAPGRGPARPPAPQPSVLSVGGSVAWLTPPSHPGAQPVVAVLDDRCGAMECEPDTSVARPFGWSVCVRDLAACGAGAGARAGQGDAGAVLDTVLRTIAQNDPGTLASSGGTLVLRGRRGAELGSVLRATPGRWRTLLLVEPSAPPARGAVTGFARVGLLEARCPLAADPAYAWARAAQGSGAQVAWFLGRRAGAARHAAAWAAVQWLFAGGDPALFTRRPQCEPLTEPSVARAARP